jgi:hypothetical protein
MSKKNLGPKDGADSPERWKARPQLLNLIT